MKAAFRKLRQYGLIQFLQFALTEIKMKLYYQLFLGSYSQFQEDLILDKLLQYRKNGFYVDVGAFDPYRFSNTMHFYRKGWSGVNVEPNKEHWKRFIKFRSHDINLNAGIGDKKGKLTFYSIDPPTLSTFQKDQADAYIKKGFKLLEKAKVPVFTLKEVLAKYAKNKKIDFLSVDVEGMEIGVLKSNDWKLYRPNYLCVESADYSDTKEGSDSYKGIRIFLKSAGYKKILDNGLNSFYISTS